MGMHSGFREYKKGTMMSSQLAVAVCPWLRVGILGFTLRLVECHSLESLASDSQISLTSLHFRKEVQP